jgi:hypothetical protein
MVGKGGNHSRELLGASAAVIIIGMVVVSYLLIQDVELPAGGPSHLPGGNDSGTGSGDVISEPKTTAQIIEEKAEECIHRNPSLTEEQCWDLKYHDMAIATNNQTLCENIKGDKIRESCDRFFD